MLTKFEMNNKGMIKHESRTLCISNGGQSAINETNMNRINDSANMKQSAKNPALRIAKPLAIRLIRIWVEQVEIMMLQFFNISAE